MNIVKEEAKNIISQLLGYGVTPDYLIEYGVSEDIIGIAFYELGYRLPSHLAHLTPTNLPPLQQYIPQQSQESQSQQQQQQQQYQSSQSHQHQQQQRFNEIVSPRTLPPKLPSTSTTNDNYINSHQALKAKVAGLEIENRKRAELLARKAANKDAAEKAVSFLDDLFAGPTATTLSTLDSSPTGNNPSGQSTSSHSSIESINYDGTEISISSDNITSHPRLSSVQEGKRAVAIDYLNSVPSLSTFTSISTRHSTNGNSSSSSFAGIDLAQSRVMIIDISDDEDSDIEEEGEEGSEDKGVGFNGGSTSSTRLILPSTSTSNSNSTSSAPLSLALLSTSFLSNILPLSSSNVVQPQPQSNKISSKLLPSVSTAPLPPPSTSIINPINAVLLPPLIAPPLPSPALSTTSTSTTGPPSGSTSIATPSAERQLWEKELEIRKIMLRIANMEKKKFERSIAGGGPGNGSRGVSREGSVMIDEGGGKLKE